MKYVILLQTHLFCPPLEMIDVEVEVEEDFFDDAVVELRVDLVFDPAIYTSINLLFYSHKYPECC